MFTRPEAPEAAIAAHRSLWELRDEWRPLPGWPGNGQYVRTRGPRTGSAADAAVEAEYHRTVAMTARAEFLAAAAVTAASDRLLRSCVGTIPDGWSTDWDGSGQVICTSPFREDGCRWKVTLTAVSPGEGPLLQGVALERPDGGWASHSYEYLPAPVWPG
jgi:hypothetical protein